MDYEVYMDYAKMKDLRGELKDLQDVLEDVAEQLAAAQSAIEDSKWTGLGHEQASIYMALVAKYAGYICGVEQKLNLDAYDVQAFNKNSAFAHMGIGHMDKAIEVLKDYRKNFQIFEKDGNSTHKKADCVVSLDEIQ